MVAVAADALEACPHCGDAHPPATLRCPKTDVLLPLKGRILDGRFRFVECIGKGGMASVWLAVNERVDRRVAIKLIRPDVARDDDLVARFRSEARAAGRIGHPNICDILDSGISPIGPYIAMELLEGKSLGEILAGGRRLPLADAVMVVREALRGLQAAHRAGIVHRDLKPENVFIHCPPAGAPIVKLMDFGVAKFTDGTGEAQTAHGALLGTPEYMAPEQFRGAAFAEARTDLWATGAILHRALTGVNAFSGATVAATLLMVASDHPPRVDELVPGLPAAVADIVTRCLAKSPVDRFADVAELDDALAPFDTASRDDASWQRILAGPSEDVPIEPPSVSHDEPSHDTALWTPTSSPNDNGRRTRRLVGGALIAALAGVAYTLRTSHDETTTSGATPVAAASDRAPTGDAPAEPTTPPFVVEQKRPPPEPEPESTPAPRPDVEPAPTTDGDPDDPTPQSPYEVPPLPPSPSADEEVVVVTDDAPRPTSGPPAGPPPPDPPGVVRDGRWIALVASGPPGPHNKADDYCEGLAGAGHLGIRRWELPNPAVAAKFTGKKGLRKGRYWTSALWRGKGLAISLPSGEKQSLPATDKKPRVLCVARWP